jgi:hypothetical protein
MHLLAFLMIPALFLSGCTGIVGNVKAPPPDSPTPTSSAPSIASNPASETVAVGNSGSFVVVATGTAPLSYQWQKNGVSIPGATLPNYITPPTHPTDDGSIFVVVVSNSLGSLMSSPAMLSVVSGSARLTADASTLSFGNVVVGSSTAMTVTLTNSGNASANVSGVNVSPSVFATVSALAGSTIAAGQSAPISFQFTPPSQTAFSGTIMIVSDASNSPITIPVSGTGIAAPAHSVSLGWAPSTTPDIVGYLILRGDVSGGPYTQLTPASISATEFTDTAVVAGHTYFYVVVAVDSTGQLSPPSNEAAVTIPTP